MTIMDDKAKERAMKLKKLEKKLLHETGRAIHDFNLIEDGDRVMVCVSGGKDSLVMLVLLQMLQKKAPIRFEILAVNLDQKQPGFPPDVLPAFFKEMGAAFEIIEEDTYSIVKKIIPEGKTTCSLCSRLRRGILYSAARRLKCNKVALGHHRDDLIETFFLNLFFNGSLKSMSPKLLNDQKDLVVIRPLAFVQERMIESYAHFRQFPIIPCNLCGSQEHLKRKEVKAMVQSWELNYPDRVDSIFAGIQNIIPTHLPDTNLFDFKNLKSEDQGPGEVFPYSQPV